MTPRILPGQDLFEIQVYPSETCEPHHTWLELHMIGYPSGSKDTTGGVYANNHQFHLTAEITHGITKDFEFAGYLVSAFVPGEGPMFAGGRLRPRFRVPSIPHFPFKLSLSSEVDFNKRGFDPNGVTMELRPILDGEWGRWYVSLNPSFSKSLKGPDAHRGFAFEPSLKAAYNVTKLVGMGFEYYAETGPVTHFDSVHDQHHILLPAIDINLSPDWELNFGVGRGLTGSSEQWLVKFIFGHRFRF